MSMFQFKQDLHYNKGFTSRLILGVYRFGHWIFNSVRAPILRQTLWIAYKLLDFSVVKIIGGAEIDARCTIGSRLRLPHGGNGIVIHPDTVLGDDVTLFHQVTLGTNDFAADDLGPPSIGNRVFIGAGAKLIGRIQIGDDVRIGANAVVITDVPASATAVGIPARVITALRP